MFTTKMTSLERRAVFSLSTIMALRMIGLFMVLPVFALYASHLSGATPFLIGLAIGIYGLTQALLQIPFGSLSDHIGRKPVILFGLILFGIGSLIAGTTRSIELTILGRALQGAGAIGSTLLAMMADLTSEEQRTKSMAIAGMTIGFSFSLAMLLGPVLTQWISVNELFLLAAALSLVAIAILYFFVPHATTLCWHRESEPELRSFLVLLTHPDLAPLNMGIFILHAIFTASFVVIPIMLFHEAKLPVNQQYYYYLPALLCAFILSLGCIGIAERKQQIKPFFMAGISSLLIAEILLWRVHNETHLLLILLSLCLFFTGFSLLEAFLPSLISRAAPLGRKGSALGIYSCAQFLGIFAGGVVGGWLYGNYHYTGVYLFCILLSLFWLALALFMQPPRYFITQTLRLLPAQLNKKDRIAAQFYSIPGVSEVTIIAEESIAYLKIERSTMKNPDFIRLKEQLQSDLI